MYMPLFYQVIKSSIGNLVKIQAMQCLINILSRDEVKSQVIKHGGPDTLIRHLKSTDSTLVRLSCAVLSSLSAASQYTELISNKGAIPALINVLQNGYDSDVLVEAVRCLGILCEDSTVRQGLVTTTLGGIQTLCTVMGECSNAELLLEICRSVSKITRRHTVNQNSFLTSGGGQHIIALTDIKNRDIQLAAVDTIHMLAEDNPYTQPKLIEDGVIGPLINLLNKSKSQVIQEKTAGALWALAGEEGEERRKMAATMGVECLIEFLGSLSEILHFIGCEGLGVLAQGAHNQRDHIAKANGVHPLVRLLKCDKEYLVLSAVRSIRQLCVGVGYHPHSVNQNTVSQARGIKLLIALMTLSSSDLIQVEAGLTLASVALCKFIRPLVLLLELSSLPNCYYRNRTAANCLGKQLQ